MIRHLVLVSFLLTFSLCVNSAEKKVNKNKSNIPNKVAQEDSEGIRRKANSIRNTIGVIVLNEQKDGDFIHIYNEDGSLWYKFTFYNDDRNGKFSYVNDDFRPFEFHLDYFVLVLKCIKKDADRYEVIVNERAELKKYIRVDDKAMKFETWEEHILQIYAIEFNSKENPLLESPQGKVKNVNLPKGEEIERTNLPIYPTFQPIKIKGDWLKVKWEIPKEKQVKRAKYDFGWIRWKKDEQLLVAFFYFC